MAICALPEFPEVFVLKNQASREDVCSLTPLALALALDG